MKSLLLALLATLVLSACGGGKAISHIGEMPLSPYEGWLKPNGDSLKSVEGKKALLECGALSPIMDAWVYQQALGIPLDDKDARFNLYFFVEGCMERSGFKKGHAPIKETCAVFSKRYAAFSACQPDAVFPERSVERRLNSWHCKLKTDVEHCRKYSRDPEACGLTKREECFRRAIKPWECSPEREKYCNIVRANDMARCERVKDELPPTPPECLP
jgi:hypothetical protein